MVVELHIVVQFLVSAFTWSYYLSLINIHLMRVHRSNACVSKLPSRECEHVGGRAVQL